MFAYVLVGLCILLGAGGQVLMKNGMNELGEIGGLSQLLSVKTVTHIVTSWTVILGLSLYAIGAFLWLGALSTLNVSVMYPLLSIGYIVAAGLAYFFLQEDITLIRWIGIGVIIVGCFLVSRA